MALPCAQRKCDYVGMEPSDGDLVQLARTGDAQALGVLLARHRVAMHAVAVARLGSGPDVDDIVQDSSLVAIASLDRLRDPDLARSWLTGITRNLCREHVRRRTDTSLDVELTGHPMSGPEEAFDRLAVRDWVWEALEALSEPLRHAVILRYFSSARSYASIAAALDIPIGTVRSRLSEARLVLTAADRRARALGARQSRRCRAGTRVPLRRHHRAVQPRCRPRAAQVDVVSRCPAERGGHVRRARRTRTDRAWTRSRRRGRGSPASAGCDRRRRP